MLDRKGVKSVNDRTWFVKGTLILTNEGWLSVENIFNTYGIEIATRNEEDDLIFQRILEYSSFSKETSVRKFWVRRRPFLFKKVFIPNIGETKGNYVLEMGDEPSATIRKKGIRLENYNGCLYSFVIPNNKIFVKMKKKTKMVVPKSVASVLSKDIQDDISDDPYDDEVFLQHFEKDYLSEIIIEDNDEYIEEHDEEKEQDLYEYYVESLKGEDDFSVPIIDEVKPHYDLENCIVVYCQKPDINYISIEVNDAKM